jgi:hypothetical protein
MIVAGTRRIIQTEDGSAVDADTGKVLFFSVERFVKDICEGNCCFICGAAPGSKPFNDEHILPKWILRKFNLFDRRITLPNNQGFTYRSYVIPCCQECNTAMGRVLEEPMQALVAAGSEAFKAHLLEKGPWLPFIWMNLIFLKVHLKDNQLRYHLDSRRGAEKIGDLYEWETLHHIHCMARVFYDGVSLDPSALGSFCLFHAKDIPGVEKFDFADLYEPRAMLLRIDDVVLFSVFNDMGMSLRCFEPIAMKLGALTPIQIREVLAHLACWNLRLVERPTFHTDLNGKGELFVEGRPPAGEPKFLEHEPESFGKVLYRCCREILEPNPSPSKQQTIDCVKSGVMTFLLDGDRFKEDSFVFDPPPAVE